MAYSIATWWSLYITAATLLKQGGRRNHYPHRHSQSVGTMFGALCLCVCPHDNSKMIDPNVLKT